MARDPPDRQEVTYSRLLYSGYLDTFLQGSFAENAARFRATRLGEAGQAQDLHHRAMKYCPNSTTCVLTCSARRSKLDAVTEQSLCTVCLQCICPFPVHSNTFTTIAATWGKGNKFPFKARPVSLTFET